MSANTQADAVSPRGVSASERAALEPAAHGAGSFSSLCAMTHRELGSLFYSPIAYVVGFIFLLLVGYSFFSETLQAGNEASFRPLFHQMAGLLVFALPILTMRSIAEEFSSGAIETLMTAPVTDGVVILGKFFGAMIFYLVLIAATIPHLIILTMFSEPVLSQILVGYLGLILIGAMFISVGIFASACTRHQLLAAILAVAILGVLTFLADYGAEYMANATAKQVCSWVNALGQFGEFNKGILNTGSLIYFVTVTFYFLFLATKVQESRRWR